MKIVIVGGVAGGATAAARLRRLDERAEIVVFERSGYISYANCGLPYYIGGTIEDAEELILQTPDSFWDRFRIDVRTRQEVKAINVEEKTVTVRELDTDKTYEESYDKLILSPGAKPIRPQLPGIDSPHLFTLRTVEDTFRIHKAVSKQKPKTAVVVGGGFIGVEMAENLAALGISVTLVEKQTQLLSQLDADMASLVHAHMKSKGIQLLLGKSVAGFEDKTSGIVTNIEADEPILSDMVILSIGVLPDSSLAADAGLALGFKNSIAVNDCMQTSNPDIYAVGDAAEITHSVSGQKALISLAGPANKQGRIAADHICGVAHTYKGSAASSVLKVFDLTVASTGINERTAGAAGVDYEKIVLSPVSHASYYPGGKVMTIKLLFERESYRILGAQIVGSDGVDKRIDVIATAMQAGITAIGLKDLDLAYAPPYSSAKDPVNMAGFMVENIADGMVKQFHHEDIADLRSSENVILLDTRTPTEYARGHAEGFRNIPLDDLRERLAELDITKPVYVMCQSGLRSYIACRILTQNGYECYNFSGGYRFYQSIDAEKQAPPFAYPCGMDKEYAAIL